MTKGQLFYGETVEIYDAYRRGLIEEGDFIDPKDLFTSDSKCENFKWYLIKSNGTLNLLGVRQSPNRNEEDAYYLSSEGILGDVISEYCITGNKWVSLHEGRVFIDLAEEGRLTTKKE